MQTMEHFGNYLYRARYKKGKFISQQVLARLSGYTQTYISLIETGKAGPSDRCRKSIMDSLGLNDKDV